MAIMVAEPVAQAHLAHPAPRACLVCLAASVRPVRLAPLVLAALPVCRVLPERQALRV
jgi:hypothetical protein